VEPARSPIAITLLWKESVLSRRELLVSVEAVIVDAVTDELVVSVETDKALAPRLLTFMEDTETALVHVSALLAPLVNKNPAGTA
jgi:hypothetical protein